MRLMVYEGTPDEIAQVIEALPKQSREEQEHVVGNGTDILPSNDEKGRTYVDTHTAQSVLRRLPLKPIQVKVLKHLYKAHPKKVGGPDLQKLVGYTSRQFSGLMGSFGRRLVHTPGYDGEAYFFDQNWDYVQGFNFYGLPEAVCEALRLEKIV